MRGYCALDKILEFIFTPVINEGAAWLGQMFSGLAQITLNVEYTLMVQSRELKNLYILPPTMTQIDLKYYKTDHIVTTKQQSSLATHLLIKNQVLDEYGIDKKN
jgi:hypothetical protein